jgi:hypothetical protein
MYMKGDDNRTSRLTLYSIGVVTENKVRGSDVITFWPTEELPTSHGKIADIKTERKSSIPDSHGVKQSSTST